MRPVVGGMVAGLLVAQLGRARASDDPPPLALQVEKGAGAESCPDAVTLAAATNALMNRTALAASKPGEGVHVVIEFARAPAGLTAVIRVVGSERAGVRTLDDASPTCGDLAEAVAVTLSVILDEERAAPAPTPPAPPPPAVALVETVKPVDAVKPAPVEQPSRRVAMAAAVEGGALLGVVGGAAPYAAADLTATWSRFVRVGLGGLAIAPQRFDIANGGGATAEVSLFAGRGFVCAFPFANVSLCALALAGALRGRTEHLPIDGARSRAWIAGGAMAGVEGSLFGPVGFSVRAAAFVPSPRHHFEVFGAGELYQPYFVAYSLGAAITATIF